MIESVRRTNVEDSVQVTGVEVCPLVPLSPCPPVLPVPPSFLPLQLRRQHE